MDLEIDKLPKKYFTEENRLIAEFMGWESNLYTNLPYRVHKDDQGMDLSIAKYHTSWDWLMPVLEKIELDLPDDSIITIEHKQCFIPIMEGEITIHTQSSSKLMACYDAVVKYIKWFNEKD